MATANILPANKEKRIKDIIAFGDILISQLPTATTSKSGGTLRHDVEDRVLRFPSTFGEASSSRCENVDKCGTSLWNLCTRLRRDFESEKTEDIPTVLILARVYGYFMLDCAHQCRGSRHGFFSRLMKIGIKAGKTCLESKQYDLATKVLARVGGYENDLKMPDSEVPNDDQEACKKLIIEYFVLRTALAWFTDQPAVAENMFEKCISSYKDMEVDTAESLADVLYELGKSGLTKKDYKIAVKWLGRAYDVLDRYDLDKLSMDANELRTSVLVSGIRACLGMHEEEELVEQAYRWLHILEGEQGDKLVVLLLKVEMLSIPTNESADSSRYNNIIQKMILTLPLSDANLKLILFHIRILYDKTPNLACHTLDELLISRLSKEGQNTWIEKALITRLWMATGQTDNEDLLKALEQTLSSILDGVMEPLSSAAIVAAQTLAWKRIDANFTQNQFDMAERWCQIALHRLFATSGELNIARISRKQILCVLAKNDLEQAKEIFSKMSETAKNDSMSQFLMYKIAVRSRDVELAADCLHAINLVTSRDSTLLYACCLESQQVGSRLQVLAALELVLEKYDYEAPSLVHLPSLLRLTIQLMSSMLEETEKARRPVLEEDIGKICMMFDKVHKLRGSNTSGISVWAVEELDWFSKNSYNLAIRSLSSWHPRHSLLLLRSCITFIDHYPADIDAPRSDDLSLRKMFCEFSAATAVVSLARGEDNIERQLQGYLELRRHVNSFDSILQNKVGKIDNEVQLDLDRKLSILSAFDFEAVCLLKTWDDLGEIIYKAAVGKNSQVYEIMADIILSSQAPSQVLVSTLKKIVNAAWELDSVDTVKLAKYMRCLFQIALVDNAMVAEELLVQIHRLTVEASETEQPYPSDEIEWITARTFNHAVDLYCGGDDDGCKKWAGLALNIAHYCADDGSLERTLQGKMLELRFDS